MKSNNAKAEKRIRRHARIRAKVKGTKDVPRLSVFKSNRFIYAQVIDDTAAKTLVSASSIAAKKGSKKVAQAIEVGKEVAQKAKAAKISKVVFDRGGFAYKGRIKAVADAAREGGLTF